uniref:Uncharacterized protein n=1 Tax=Daphnia galeata TaxID=27404 RepID=A0A8J2WCX4_9CRUS|nr:unnamed protein product [Daphnia galeata]
MAINDDMKPFFKTHWHTSWTAHRGVANPTHPTQLITCNNKKIPVSQRKTKGNCIQSIGNENEARKHIIRIDNSSSFDVAAYLMGKTSGPHPAWGVHYLAVPYDEQLKEEEEEEEERQAGVKK